jgi:hypothetical protein
VTPPDRPPADEAADSHEEAAERRKRRAAVRPHESGTDDRSASEQPLDQSGSDDDWAPPGVDPDDVPSYFPELSVEDPDPPRIVDHLGSVGIYLAVAAFGLAVIGIGAAARGIQPLGNAVITLSLGLGIVAMLFAMVFQAFASDLLSGSE